MALFKVDVYSSVLDMDTHLNVILPHDITNSDKPAKVLYLLHGLSDDCSKWTRYTAIERKIRNKHLAVIMPEVQRSFYADMKYGIDYFKYIAYELPQLCQKMFNISDKREDTYIAGLSMGGYGALKTAFTRPEQFSKAASFSGAVYFKKSLDEKTDNIYNVFNAKELVAICGPEVKFSDLDDPFFLAKKALESKNTPEVLLTCGTEDFLYQGNLKFKDYLEEINYKAKFIQWEGDHTWQFWDQSLDHLFEFLGV